MRELSGSFKRSQAIPRLAELVAPELVGCLLVQGQPFRPPLWGLVVESERYSQGEWHS